MAADSSVREIDDRSAGAPAGDTASSVLTTQPPTPEDKTVISKRPPLALNSPTFASAPHIFGSTLVGKRLEHYELNEFVGGGGMGAVFRATDTRLGRTVAVKVLSRDQGDEETIRRFQNEAQSAARLDHPNIARVFYVGEDQGVNFIVFEFIEGTNLRDDVERNGPLELERALHYTLQVAEALAHSSGREVIHRDIKPSNVLVTASGQVKLVDMGLARMHAVEASADDLTASGVTLGTFDYISPEQARDPRVADVRSDIYSLGCTLFFMLTRQPPFPDGTALQKLLRHNSDEPPDVRLFRPELSSRVAALLMKILAKKPSQRQQSAAELISDIVGLGKQLGLASVAEYGSAVALPALNYQQWRDKAWQAVAAVVLLVVLIVGSELVLWPRHTSHGMVVQPTFKSREPVTADESARGTNNRAQNAQPDTAVLRTASEAAREGAAARHSAGGEVEPVVGASSRPSDESGSRESSAGNAAAPPALEAAPVPEIKTIAVLGEGPAPPQPHTEYVESLSQACARAIELGLNEIELRFNGPHVEQPLEIGNQRISIRASEGFRPIIVFRPQVGTGERQMIRLTGGGSPRVEFEGVELRLELPDDLPADGWSLFGMSTGQSLDFARCVLTVQDGDDEQLPIHEQVAMIAVQRRRPSETMTAADMQLAMGQQARIGLERTIARGEASLIGMTDETPLTVRWNQGLLVSSRHLIETGGSAAEPQYYEQIVIDLDHVTACCRQGLYYLRRGPGKPYQFYVSAYTNHCVFVTDPGAALFEMCGLSAPPGDDELQSAGEGNRFSPTEMPFLFVRPSLGGEPQAFRLGRRWSSETRSQAGVPWLSVPALHRPPHDAAKGDFLIDFDPDFETGAGFDPLLLPECGPSSASQGASETGAAQLKAKAVAWRSE